MGELFGQFKVQELQMIYIRFILQERILDILLVIMVLC